MSVTIWYGTGGDDALSLGDPAILWRLFGEISRKIQGASGYEELESVPGFAEQEVTPWWMQETRRQAEAYLRTYGSSSSPAVKRLLESLIRQIKQAKVSDSPPTAEQMARPPVEESEEDDPGQALAVWYARVLTALEAAGQDVDGEAERIEEELGGTGWAVVRGRGAWHAVHEMEDAEDAPEQMAAGGERAPKGGIVLNGRHYRGGQFIPGKEIAKASPEDRQRLEQAKVAAAGKQAERTNARKARGSVDQGKLTARLQQHAQAHPLDGLQRRQAASMASLLHRHHGELALHRVEELADRLEQALQSIDDDHPNVEGLRKNLGEQLARLHQAAQAIQGKGVTGEVKGGEPPSRAAVSPKRDRSGEPITFAKPIVGPSGVQLLDYNWKWQPYEEYDAKRDEVVSRKISDWDQAERSLHSGRNVVHHFRIRTPEGKTQIVSLESALQLLGYGSGDKSGGAADVRSLASAVKTLARQQMELDLHRQKHAAYHEAAQEADNKIAEMDNPGVQRTQTAPGIALWSMGDVSVQDFTGERILSRERQMFLQEMWRNARRQELLPSEFQGYDPVAARMKIDDLEKRAAAAQKKVASLAAEVADRADDKKEGTPGFTGTDSLGRQWRDGELVTTQKEEGAGKVKGGVTPPISAATPPTTDTHASLARAFLAHPGAQDNLVSLADLQRATGLSREQLHAAVQDLRQRGLVTLSGSEGRHAAEQSATGEKERRDRDAAIDEDGRKLAYLSVRGDQEDAFGALAQAKQSSEKSDVPGLQRSDSGTIMPSGGETTPSGGQAMTKELPKLSGSQKQVAWAEKIRAEKIAQAEGWLENAKKSLADPVHADYRDHYAKEVAELEAALEYAHTVTSASQWIDWRRDKLRQMAKEAGAIPTAKAPAAQEGTPQGLIQKLIDADDRYQKAAFTAGEEEAFKEREKAMRALQGMSRRELLQHAQDMKADEIRLLRLHDKIAKLPKEESPTAPAAAPTESAQAVPAPEPTPVQSPPSAPAAELPKLAGSDKQVAWAEQIRQEAMQHVPSGPLGDAMRSVAASQTDSQWWITKKRGADAAAGMLAAHIHSIPERTRPVTADIHHGRLTRAYAEELLRLHQAIQSGQPSNRVVADARRHLVGKADAIHLPREVVMGHLQDAGLSADMAADLTRFIPPRKDS